MDRIQAILDFPAILNKQQLQQFLGCTNWVRAYMEKTYPALVKMLAKYLKADAVFPARGLGLGDQPDDKVVKAIKKCSAYYIHLAVLAEARAIDGTCPLRTLPIVPALPGEGRPTRWWRTCPVSYTHLTLPTILLV